MDQPLAKWYCDKCGSTVPRNDGYVIWKTNDDLKAFGFKIIHKTKCDTDKGYIASSDLEDFLGENGVAYLLSKLSLGTLIKQLRKETFTQIQDFDEFVDFFRRVQVPYYEEARRYFKTELTRDQCSDWDETSTYFPEQLKKLIQQNEGEGNR
jgi:hypothetical protein